MWSAQSAIYYTAPMVVTAGGVYLLYRATQLEGSAAEKAFVLGMMFVFSSWGFTAARSSRRRSTDVERVATENRRLCKRVRQLEQQYASLREDVHSKITVKAWMEAMDRAEAHHSTSWVHVHEDE